MSVLNERAKIILIIEWTLCFLGTIGIFGLVIYLWTNFDFLVEQIMSISPSTTREHAARALKIYIICLGVIGLIACLIQVALNAVLHMGVHQMRAGHLKFWYICIFVGLVLGTIGVIIGILNGTTPWLRVIGYLAALVYRGISIKIIKEFKDEIVNSGGTVYTTA